MLRAFIWEVFPLPTLLPNPGTGRAGPSPRRAAAGYAAIGSARGSYVPSAIPNSHPKALVSSCLPKRLPARPGTAAPGGGDWRTGRTWGRSHGSALAAPAGQGLRASPAPLRTGARRAVLADWGSSTGLEDG
ncbi:syntaxin-binding protein 6 isoform X5 [Cuculus canorus]|uniref:syntaxin-binding protein 6 isoform X5 n=1 Tax=Cuculus canorus TaxID=55661 RepID=UPI0023AAABC8|nr:syntaxin-binding protein 6 isoform X5 [Cuculus canorus]